MVRGFVIAATPAALLAVTLSLSLSKPVVRPTKPC
jgi:hypothetical protein